MVIGFLAKMLRGLSWVAGATPPPPGKNELRFVFIWIGVIVFGIAFCAIALYLVLHVLTPS
jgi:hypothetical protein